MNAYRTLDNKLSYNCTIYKIIYGYPFSFLLIVSRDYDNMMSRLALGPRLGPDADKSALKGEFSMFEHIRLHEDSYGHARAEELSREQTLALMSYMLEHNKSHAGELHTLTHALELQGKGEAAAAMADALHSLEHCTDKIGEALLLLKED